MKKLYKITIFVPEADAEKIRKAIGEAGAGKIGNYSFCTTSIKCIDRFKPEKGANPAVGKIGKIEAVKSERIETVCEKDKLNAVLLAIKKVHPYEAPSVDVFEIMIA